jgi:hypothetical protein
VTDTVLVSVPDVKVTVAVREEVAALLAAVSVVAMPVPDVVESVSQAWLLDADHDPLQVTVTCWLPPVADGAQVVGETLSVGVTAVVANVTTLTDSALDHPALF